MSAVPRVVLAAYAAPAFSQALIHGPVNTVIQGVYGKYFALPLTSIALVLVIARVFDGLTDPLIGYFSDRFRSRFGRRKPWLLAGSALAVVACWQLYIPPEQVTVSYFLIWFLLAYLGWTISEIPYRAWMSEISGDFHERTRLAVWRTFARYMGFIAFYGIPFLPIFPSSDFTPETLRWTAWLAAFALPLTAIVACWIVPSEGDAAGASTKALSPGKTWSAVWRNGPLRTLLGTYAVGGLATGSAFGAMFFFVDGYLQLGATLALLFVLGAPTGALCMPFWAAMCRRVGKQRTWAVAYALSGAFMLMHLLIPVGGAGEPWLIACFLLVFAVSSVGVVVPASMLADIVDYGRWKYGEDYAGTYFSAQTMVEKGVEGLGVAMGLAVAGWFGFNPAEPSMNDSARLGLMLAFPILPALLTWATVPVILNLPITEERHRAIRSRLKRRADKQYREGLVL
ncbi:MAG: MFS transporter [Congregibacter sp.]